MSDAASRAGQRRAAVAPLKAHAVAAPAMPGRWDRLRYPAISVLSVTTLLTLWAVIANVFHTSPMVLPSPQVMAEHLGDMLVEGYAGQPLWDHILASLIAYSDGLFPGHRCGDPDRVMDRLQPDNERDMYADPRLHPADPADRVHSAGDPVFRYRRSFEDPADLRRIIQLYRAGQRRGNAVRAGTISSGQAPISA